MQLQFYKYQGTGNDFVMIDNRRGEFPKNNTKFVSRLCDRKFGIGADGLILLEDSETANFSMIYYNADGNPGSMCGNGARCITHFARFLGIIEAKAKFEAVDGVHHATIEGDVISLKMQDVNNIEVYNHYCYLNTGSPHHVAMVTGLQEYDVFNEGRSLRNSLYGTEGANINFVEAISEDTVNVRTYERGVEDETLSCGTGVTAVALALAETGMTTGNEVSLQTPGGVLKVSYKKTTEGYEDIFLIGPATMVFKGEWE
ncbi:diaminopimelate epimerase [Constantimarinum furrinae]|uniref:Diaminopimelate epimerase n=1 Tax=Constantimarinum furrinae TaxID=2562285 RepID=A0A7G8PQI4_9FLAO|nr:diaminopimelate epimerase [Constantimarinum furrinae]QNJ96600.1 Diaminopimelate epimerase [Constantimarinum furrinae]